jgi:hypothetical protein
MNFASPIAPPKSVQRTAELQRVINLPRRTWSDSDAQSLADKLTEILKTPHGKMALRPIQAIALMEASTTGLFGAIGVGKGKTLLSFLAAYCMEAKRPLLIVPAKLKEKTIREMRMLALHWRIPNFIRVETYELLGRIQAAEMFDNYKPDLIILDECHRVKNRKAAVTRRLLRYLEMAQHCRLIAMSGSITSRSIKDYAHLLHRCIVDAPIPRSVTEVEEWADAIDEMPENATRTGTGALVLLCDQEEARLYQSDPVSACRKAFRRRFIETEGVVGTTEIFSGSSLWISPIEPVMGPKVIEAFKKLREDWELPDGQPLADGLSTWRHAREIALGFYYKWDPTAPTEWMAKRKAWCSACRYILNYNRRNLDSELQVTKAVAEGLYPEKLEIYEDWCKIRDSFEPHTVPVWLDDTALKACTDWAKQGSGIIWTEHDAFSKKLSELSGLPYFGKQGKDAKGRMIEDASPEEVVIASIASNGEGRNLQAWCRNLITSLPPNGRIMEQLLGRTHREDQKSDEVSYQYLVTCPEHIDAMERAKADALYIEHSTGQKQKLLYADLDLPKRVFI